VLLSTLTASVLVGTLLPIITASLRGGPLVAGPEWFQRVTGPQLAALALLMGVCPLVGRLATGRPPEGAPSTRPAWRSGKHRTVGGYLVHVGVLVIALGVVGTGHQAHDAPLVLSRGESAIVLDYELTFEDLWQSRGVDEETTWATVAVYRGGTLRARLYPRLTHDPKWQRVVATPAVWATLREDLYLVLAGWAEGREAATFHVAVNPLVSLIWAGGLILLLGGAIALCPGRSGAPRGSKLE